MTPTIPGLHHVTAISGPAQRTVDFYAGALGLRLVKKTVNFDDPGTYHLYFGDQSGAPGTILTFFPWAGAVPGRAGAGMTGETSYSVAAGSLDRWLKHFSDLRSSGEMGAFDFEAIDESGNDRRLPFRDPDGLPLALVERDLGGGDDGRIRSFDGVRLLVRDPEPTAKLLTEVFGYAPPRTEGNGLRLEAASDATGRIVDLIPATALGRNGAGTVHHVAFRVASDALQKHFQDAIASFGLPVTDVKDRNYFRSIYFREPGGVLFEIATDPPGFLIDEDEEGLGVALRLPSQFEASRERIESRLPELRLPGNLPRSNLSAAESGLKR